MMSHSCRRFGVLFVVVVALALSVTAVEAGGKKKGKSHVSDDILALHPDILELREKVSQSPADATLHNDLANLYARQGWDDLAIATYHEAVHLDPRLHVAWTNLGTIYSKLGHLNKAAKAFQKAIDIEPLAALAHYNLGVVRERLGDYAGALESYKTAVTFNPALLDPGVNPQIVNNRNETVIRLLKYLEEVGSSSLPLEDTTRDLPEAAGEEQEQGEPLAVLGDTPADGFPAPQLLGSLRMYKGHAARRLHERADREAPAGDTPSRSEAPASTNDLSIP